LEGNSKSIIVVADTHFGLNKAGQNCDPKAFGYFLKWIKDLERGEKEVLELGAWGLGEVKKVEFDPPEQLILLGDILELWDASNEAVFASIMNIIQPLSKLNCEKIYVLGNHDYDIETIVSEDLSKYPLGESDVTIVKDEYRIVRDVWEYCFKHGHQFDRLVPLHFPSWRIIKPITERWVGITFPSWRFMPPIRRAALAFGNYAWIFFGLFIMDLILVLGGLERIDIMTFLLGALSLPFFIFGWGRKAFNWLKTAKFKPTLARKRTKKELWWEFPKDHWRVSGHLPPLTVIYGHTHVIDAWEERLENPGEIPRTILDVLNLPSWVCESSGKENTASEREGIKKELSHVFLYIGRGLEPLFVGWDINKRKPYFIPRDVVHWKREYGNLSNYKTEYAGYVVDSHNIRNELIKIGWSQKLVDNWITGFKK